MLQHMTAWRRIKHFLSTYCSNEHLVNNIEKPSDHKYKQYRLCSFSAVNFRLIISKDCETVRYILIKQIFTAPFFAI